MRKKQNSLKKSKQDFQLKIKTRLIEKIRDIGGSNAGESIYLRPLGDDEQMITEIAYLMKEKKSTVVQRLLHLVLHTAPNDSTRENRQLELLEWLVENEKHHRGQEEIVAARLERLEDHAREMEIIFRRAEESSHFMTRLLAEIYGLTNVCVTLLNQIFTRIIEYFSPVEIEKKNSLDFANQNILGAVRHALSELDKIADHHHFDNHDLEPEMLYLFTKIDLLKARLLTASGPAHSEQSKET